MQYCQPFTHQYKKEITVQTFREKKSRCYDIEEKIYEQKNHTNLAAIPFLCGNNFKIHSIPSCSTRI